MITIKDYAKGRDLLFPEEWALVRSNAIILLEKVNGFLGEMFPGKIFGVSSGWRPKSINDKTPGAAPNSYHVKARGIDLDDHTRFLKINFTPEIFLEHAELLRKFGLWLENPKRTPTWCHLDDGDRPERPSRTFFP